MGLYQIFLSGSALSFSTSFDEDRGNRLRRTSWYVDPASRERRGEDVSDDLTPPFANSGVSRKWAKWERTNKKSRFRVTSCIIRR